MEDATFLDMDFREEQVLQNAGQSVDQYINIATDSLNELFAQRTMLKVAKFNSGSAKAVIRHGQSSWAI
jgi:hypothetical protein